MISFSELSPLLRAFFSLWALLVCLINISNAILAFSKKKYLFGFFGVILFLPIYFLWQIIFDLSLSSGSGDINVISKTFIDIDWIYWLLVFIILTVLTVILFLYNIHYERNHITVNSIKLYLDKIDCGVCYFKENGQVLFANMCINRLSYKLMGTPLLNGHQFIEAIKDKIVSIDEERWKFSIKDVYFNNETLHEITAANITSEYTKTQLLEKDKYELSRLNEELQEYHLSIDEVVRHQEILQAKINIHDEMNRLMLSSVSVQDDDIASLNHIFELWEENASLLSLEGEKNISEMMEKHIEELAKALNMKLIWKGSLPPILNEEERNIFYMAAQEAIANASKHAKADELVISITQNNDRFIYQFINNGAMPKNDIVFTGGLLNLSKVLKKHNVSLEVSIDKRFILTLSFIHK